MKYIYLKLIFAIFVANPIYSQTPIRDTHITNQAKRDVVTDWAPMLPNPNYNFFGIQTNIHYTFTWGWFAPSQNDDYRNGEDIRPYKQGGKGLTTFFNYGSSNAFTNLMSDDSQIIGDEAEDELAYNTAVTYPSDPLYMLYYKDKLEPVRDWNATDFINDIDTFIANNVAYEVSLSNSERIQLSLKLSSSGIMTSYIDHMDILKERFDMATTLSMGRGKRIISYHEIMLDYRKLNNGFKKSILMHARLMVHLIRNSNVSILSLENTNGINQIQEIDDEAIMINILANYGDLIKM